MLINVGEIREREQPLVVDSTFEGSDLGLDSVQLLEPASFLLKIRAQGEVVYVSGHVTTRVRQNCCRCVEDFESALHKTFDLEYRTDPETSVEGEEVGLSYADLTVGFYRHDEIDLKSLITEQILLELPMKPVCGSDCRGFCDQCGTNLNWGNCGCSGGQSDPRLAPLQELKKRLSN